jgi:hypothetical protein
MPHIQPPLPVSWERSILAAFDTFTEDGHNVTRLDWRSSVGDPDIYIGAFSASDTNGLPSAIKKAVYVRSRCATVHLLFAACGHSDPAFDLDAAHNVVVSSQLDNSLSIIAALDEAQIYDAVLEHFAVLGARLRFTRPAIKQSVDEQTSALIERGGQWSSRIL